MELSKKMRRNLKEILIEFWHKTNWLLVFALLANFLGFAALNFLDLDLLKINWDALNSLSLEIVFNGLPALAEFNVNGKYLPFLAYILLAVISAYFFPLIYISKNGKKINKDLLLRAFKITVFLFILLPVLLLFTIFFVALLFSLFSIIFNFTIAILSLVVASSLNSLLLLCFNVAVLLFFVYLLFLYSGSALFSAAQYLEGITFKKALKFNFNTFVAGRYFLRFFFVILIIYLTLLANILLANFVKAGNHIFPADLFGWIIVLKVVWLVAYCYIFYILMPKLISKLYKKVTSHLEEEVEQ